MSTFRPGDIVKCVRASSHVIKDKLYEVEGVSGYGLKLKDVQHEWNPGRFVLVNAAKPSSRYKAGDWVVCELPFAGVLKKGRIYRIASSDETHVTLLSTHYLYLRQPWHQDRFSPFVPFKAGDIVECIESDGGSRFIAKGARYTVVRTDDQVLGEPGVFLGNNSGIPHFAWRFKKVDEKVSAPNDLSTLKAMLDRAGTKYRTWNITEWVDRNDALVRGEAIVLVFGSENDGPYTEFLFNRDGSIIKDGAKAIFSRGCDYEVG